MIHVLYRSPSVGPVCKRLAAANPQIVPITNEQIFEQRPYPKILVRWDSKEETIPGSFELEINTQAALDLVRDKVACRKALGDLAPRSYFSYPLISPTFPLIVRPKRHHGGRKLFFCNIDLEVRRAIRKCRQGWYASDYVKKSEEYRVFILQGYIVCVSQRFPADENQIAWNLAAGGRLVNVRRNDWPIKACLAALKAAAKLSLDWAVVDVCVDQADQPFVFEANTAPGLRNKYTIGQIAKAFASISGPTELPVFSETDTWKKLLHPSLR